MTSTGTHRLQGPVVTAVPEQRVVLNPQFVQPAAEFSDGPVHGCDLTIEMLQGLFLICVRHSILIESFVWPMWRTKPDHSEEGGAFGNTTVYELESGINRY